MIRRATPGFEQIAQLAASWSLVIGEPLLPGGQCAWVAPARDRVGRELVLKAGWRHPEARTRSRRAAPLGRGRRRLVPG